MIKNLKEELNKQEIKQSYNMDFAKIREGYKILSDPSFTIGDITKEVAPRIGTKRDILRALAEGHIDRIREISRVYYNISGIYKRLCRYLAYLFKYDIFVTPTYNKELDKNGKDKLLKLFKNFLTYLEDFNFKKFFGEVALKVILNGCYCGYRVFDKGRITIQELPIHYCRSRFTSADGDPVIEFDMSYFRYKFPTEEQREKILKIFPKEFKKGYRLYEEGKLLPCFVGDRPGWYMLDIGKAFKFNIGNSDMPILASVIPEIIELDNSKKIDRERQVQKLFRLIVQKLPLNRQDLPVFSEEESIAIHRNAIEMLGNNPGVNVLTTFADSKVEDMSDSAAAATVNDISKGLDEIYDEAGISRKVMNTDGNITIDKSIANDESAIFGLILQFEKFLNSIARDYVKQKKFSLKVKILETTIYNYKDLSKQYRDLAQMGYSKMMPSVALGLSQKFVLDNLSFEEDVLELSKKINEQQNIGKETKIDNNSNSSGSNTKDNNPSINDRGRPTKESLGETVSDKTIQNREAMG